MAQVTNFEATRQDIEAFFKDKGPEGDRLLLPTMRAWIFEIGDYRVAIGGFALIKGRWFGFMDITEKGREYLAKNIYVKLALLKGLRYIVSIAKTMGIKFLYVDADTRYPKAEELLRCVGFVDDPRTPHILRWSANNG